MAKSGIDVRIADYHQRLLDMVRADVDNTKPAKDQEAEARSIMDRLLGKGWREKAKSDSGESAKDDSKYIDLLDQVGSHYGLGRAPFVAGPLEVELPEQSEEPATDDGTEFMRKLRDALNKALGEK